MESDYIYVTARKRLYVIMFAYDEYISMLENSVNHYGIVMLLMVITCIVGVTSNLYIISSMFLDVINGKITSINRYILIHSTYWSILTFGRIIHFVSTINIVREEVIYLC